jgi:hypothetical protein
LSTKIHDARVRAGLTAAEIGSAVGRSSGWMNSVEGGLCRISPEHEQIILVAIERLARFRRTVEQAREKLVSDLKLPALVPVRNGREPIMPSL